jgi:predicted deacylase
VTVIACDADEVALLRSWRGRGLVVVVDPSHAGPGRVRRFDVPRPDSGGFIVFTVETGDTVDAGDAARQVADAVAAEIAVHARL